MVISSSHALYLISLITLCNVIFFLIQGANKVVVVVGGGGALVIVSEVG